MPCWRYADQILHVDLTAGAAWTVPTSLELKRDYVGGAGFVARLLADAAAVRETAVVMATGPLSDETAGRLAVGAWPGRGLSSLGGRMAAALKNVGYDALVITGTLAQPGCLVLEPGDVRVVPADDLWGLDVPDAEAALLGRLGRGYAAMVLGPAAENGVPFATLAHDGHHAGGSGVGAALGGRRLKALAVRDRTGMPSRCAGCTLACPSVSGADAGLAGALGLDAPTAVRLATLARGCAEAGILPVLGEPLTEIAHRRGAGSLLAEGEAVAVQRLGPAAARLARSLPRPKRRGGPGVADLLGTCQRIWQERPGQVLREALCSTLGLIS